MTDVGIAGEVVEVVLDFAGRQMPTKMLYGCRGAPMWVRADPDTLGFIQHAIHANFIANVPRPRRQQAVDEDDDDNQNGQDDENDDA